MADAAAPRVLLAVLVHDGRDVVPRCLESAHLRSDLVTTDVLILDDASPEPGWSTELEQLCRGHGFAYYCSPRNLGIPRNMNLALLAAMQGNYDHVVLCNSDVILPANATDAMVTAMHADPRIATVTPWSNNVTLFTLPNDGTQPELATRAAVDWVSTTLEEVFSGAVLNIPTGHGFCLMMRTEAVRSLGLMDPIFGRGYFEEVDWCLRAGEAGWRNVLAPNVFVFHEGGVSTTAAGFAPVRSRHYRVNETILDHRHPAYRGSLARFVDSFAMPGLIDQATRQIVRCAAEIHGVRFGGIAVGASPESVRVVVRERNGHPALVCNHLGFSHAFEIDPNRPATDQLPELLGVRAGSVRTGAAPYPMEWV